MTVIIVAMIPVTGSNKAYMSNPTRTIRATDLYSLTECDRMVYLNHNRDKNLRDERSEYQKYLAAEGEAFEDRVVATLKVEKPAYIIGDLETGWQQTLELMQNGAKIIYQGVLLHDDVVGVPDLLIRVDDVASALGTHIYRPVDIKLASKSKKGHRLQVMCYAWLLEQIQTVRPVGSLYLKDAKDAVGLFTEEIVKFDAPLFNAYLAETRLLAAGEERKPFISSVCKMCGWQSFCTQIAEENHDASLLPGMRRTVWQMLHTQNRGRISDVTNIPREELLNIKGVGDKVADKILRHAQALTNDEAIIFKKIKLPAPSPYDVFYDIESIPNEQFHYLMGYVVKRDGTWVYEYDLAEKPADEGLMWLSFLARLDAFLGHKGAHVYHYGAYEKTAIKQLTERHGGTERAERLMDRLVNLEKAIKKSIALPLRSYSLKAVAPWLGFSWDSETTSGGDSVLDFIHWLENGDRTYINRILHYNEEDCHATVAVRDWLWETKSEAEKTLHNE